MNVRNKRIIITGLISYKSKKHEELLSGLENDITSAGGEVVGRLTQRRGPSRSKTSGGSKKLEQPLDSSAYISKGKVVELSELCIKTEADVIIFINPLSYSQKEKIQDIVNCQVTCL